MINNEKIKRLCRTFHRPRDRRGRWRDALGDPKVLGLAVRASMLGALVAAFVFQSKILAWGFVAASGFTLIGLVLAGSPGTFRAAKPAPLPREPACLPAHLAKAGFGVGSQVSCYLQKGNLAWVGTVVEVDVELLVGVAMLRRHDTDEEYWLPLSGILRQISDVPNTPGFGYVLGRKVKEAP